jgi:predicted metal-dependent hydrolase
MPAWVKQRPSSILVGNARAKTHRITVDGLVVEVVRKKIKNLHLTVYPPDGRVRVSAPLRANDEAVRLMVTSRLAWIRRHQARLAAQERPPPPQYVSGESHLYLGDRYVLNVMEHDGRQGVVCHDTRLDLFVRRGSDAGQRERVLQAWYRRQLKAAVPPLINKWEAILGVKVAEWRVKRMKTRWGSCNPKARRIWLNLELAKRPPRCLEYIVVHEMVHLLVRKHDRKFVAHMDRVLPQWRQVRDELTQAPLA